MNYYDAKIRKNTAALLFKLMVVIIFAGIIL